MATRPTTTTREEAAIMERNLSEDAERCSRCGDEITDANRSARASDDMCADCRYEYDLDGD